MLNKLPSFSNPPTEYYKNSQKKSIVCEGEIPRSSVYFARDVKRGGILTYE
jgi:hypothetical protein